MVAILQLKASKHFVYFVSVAVVTFTLLTTKKYKHTYIIGDLNLESVNWENNSSSDNTQSLFLDLFNNLGLTQFFY